MPAESLPLYTALTLSWMVETTPVAVMYTGAASSVQVEAK